MKLSLCIICKNEQEKIKRCIKSVKEIVDEVIVVDTGSEDSTIVLAKEQGAIVYEIQWEKDFAKAKNYAIDKATGDWIIFLDADEYFAQESLQYIRPLIKATEKSGEDSILLERIDMGDNIVINTIKLNRIFKRDKRLRYKGAIHELLVYQGRSLTIIDYSEKIKLYHDGYYKENMASKVKRNSEILLSELEKNSKNSNTHFYLAQTYHIDGNIEKAYEHAVLALKYDNFTLLGSKEGSYVTLLAMSSYVPDNYETENYYKSAIKYNNTYPDFDFHYGEYLLSNNEIVEGIRVLEQSLEKIEKYKGLVLSNVTTQIDKIYHRLASLYIYTNQVQKAIVKLVQLLKADKYDYNALYKLLEILKNVESPENVIEFLSKLYDDNLTKDKFALLKISKMLEYIELYNYYYEKLTGVEKEILLEVN